MEDGLFLNVYLDLRHAPTVEVCRNSATNPRKPRSIANSLRRCCRAAPSYCGPYVRSVTVAVPRSPSGHRGTLKQKIGRLGPCRRRRTCLAFEAVAQLLASSG